MRGVIVLGLLCARPALADEDAAIETRFLPDRAASASGFAAVEAGSRIGAGVAIGGEVELGASACNLTTSGEAAARIGQTALSAAHALHACVATLRIVDADEGFDATMFPAWIDHELAWNAVPRLSSRRVMWNLPYTSERLEGGFALASIDADPELSWAIVPIPIQFRGEWWFQDAIRGTYSEIGAALVEGRERDGDGEAFLLRASFADDLDRVTVIGLERVPISSTPLRLDAAFGSADVQRTLDGDFVRTGGFTGRLGLWLDAGDLRAGLSADRDYYPAIDDAIVGETRTEARISYAHERREVTLTAFRARSTLMPTDGAAETNYQPVHGVGLQASWPLYRNLEGRIDAEWARSFYARGGEMLPAPAAGLELNAQLVARFGR